MPQFIGRHTIFQGFGGAAFETPARHQAYTWWGSDCFRLPAATRETNVRLQVDGGSMLAG